MNDDDHDDGFDLVMPFVATEDNGGPFDSDAFTAGWTCGDLARRLWSGADVEDVYLDPRLLEQVDLIAMRAGYFTVIDADRQDPATGRPLVHFTTNPEEAR